LLVPRTGWLQCKQGRETIEYRLEDGKLDIEVAPPGYDTLASEREDADAC
jgi:hypothetical protein